MEDKINVLKYAEGHTPMEIGDKRKVSSFIGEPGDKEGEIVERSLISIRDNIAFIKYSVKIPAQPDDDYPGDRMFLSIEKYILEGEYADYSSIPEYELDAFNRETEEIFELFTEVVKEDIRNEHRTIKPRISSEVLSEIEREMDYQDDKWGNKEQSLPGYLLIMKKEIDEAIDGWMRGDVRKDSRNSPLHEIVQVVAVGVQCLEQYGTAGCTINTNDIRDDNDALTHLVHLATTPEFAPNKPFTNIPIVSFDQFLKDPEPSVDEILAANGVVHMENIDTSKQIEENS